MAKVASKTKDVVKKETSQLPSTTFSVDDAKIGGEVDSDDLALPRLTVLQGLSWALDPDKPNYIKGAVAGDIVLSVLNHHWSGKEGVEVCFCHFSKFFEEKQPQELGGNRVAIYQPEDPVVVRTPKGDKGRRLLSNGNELVETAYHAILVKVGDRWVQALLTMAKTRIKISKKLNSILTTQLRPDGEGNMVPAARWYRIFRMTSAKETWQGKSWNSPVFDILPVPKDDQGRYDLGREWAIAAGRMNAKFPIIEEAQREKAAVEEF